MSNTNRIRAENCIFEVTQESQGHAAERTLTIQVDCNAGACCRLVKNKRIVITGKGRSSTDGQFLIGRGFDPGWTGGEHLPMGAQFDAGRGINPGWTGGERLPMKPQVGVGGVIDPGWTGKGRDTTGHVTLEPEPGLDRR